MNINGKWYTETELQAYVKELESRISELEDKHFSECGQVAHYSDENAKMKELLKAAVEDIHELLCDKKNLDGNEQSCNICSYIEWCPCCKKCIIREDKRNWRYADEALALIGGGENDT